MHWPQCCSCPEALKLFHWTLHKKVWCAFPPEHDLVLQQIDSNSFGLTEDGIRWLRSSVLCSPSVIRLSLTEAAWTYTTGHGGFRHVVTRADLLCLALVLDRTRPAKYRRGGNLRRGARRPILDSLIIYFMVAEADRAHEVRASSSTLWQRDT